MPKVCGMSSSPRTAFGQTTFANDGEPIQVSVPDEFWAQGSPRSRTSDDGDGALEGPPVSGSLGGPLPDVPRLHTLHQALERAQPLEAAGQSTFLEIGRAAPRQIEVGLLHPPCIESAPC
jgi:hypothetical protein